MARFGNQNMDTGKILLVDDDYAVLAVLSAVLREEGMSVEPALSVSEALRKVRSQPADVIVTDVHLPDGSGIDLLKKSREIKPDVPVIIITGYGSIEEAVEAVKLGAHDYIHKPFRNEALRVAVMRALEQRAICRENNRLRDAQPAQQQLDGLISHDYRMQKICETILNIADSNANVLIEGESGTGKTLVAKLIHKNSPRRGGPFVEVSCAALPEGLLESELFGHIRGAFTTAYSDRDGKFQAADGGTILLDEIDSASAQLQMRLLNAVQFGTFQRVGDNETMHVDVRILAATNRSLLEETRKRRFREDLYHRLNVISLRIPALRERIRDIPPLCSHFAEELACEHNRPTRPLSRETIQHLVRHRWPGNVRELRNVIEHGVIMSAGDAIELDHLPTWTRTINVSSSRGPNANSLREAMQRPERHMILGALRQAGWNKRLAAQKLGVSRSTLYNKIKEHHLQPGV